MVFHVILTQYLVIYYATNLYPAIMDSNVKFEWEIEVICHFKCLNYDQIRP